MCYIWSWVERRSLWSSSSPPCHHQGVFSWFWRKCWSRDVSRGKNCFQTVPNEESQQLTDILLGFIRIWSCWFETCSSRVNVWLWWTWSVHVVTGRALCACWLAAVFLDELLLFSLTPESAPSGLCLLMTGRPPAQTGDTAVGFTHTLQSRPVNRSAVWNLMRHVFLSRPEMLFLMSPCDFGEENTAAIFPIKPFSACRASHDRNKECLSLWRCVCVVYVHVSVSATLSFSLCSPLCRNCFHGCFSDVLPSSDHLPCCVRWSFNQPLQVHQTH